ncbi:MAG: HNH endonuclease signature motif containing protein [Cyanobacteria bacterium J06560_6]
MAKRTAIPREMRRQVAKRADYLCEYCLISEEDTFLGCHVDHIISVKHGGSMTFDNLAYACVVCNRQKGSDLGSIDWKTKNLVRFFNPRLDQWSKHFYLQEARLISRTSIGEVTVRILTFNSASQIVERQVLIDEKRYPSSAAMQRMSGD